MFKAIKSDKQIDSRHFSFGNVFSHYKLDDNGRKMFDACYPQYLCGCGCEEYTEIITGSRFNKVINQVKSCERK